MSKLFFFPPSFSTPGPTFLSPMIPSLAIAMSSLTGRFATLPGNVLKLCCTSGPRYCDHSDHSANRLTAGSTFPSRYLFYIFLSADCKRD